MGNEHYGDARTVIQAEAIYGGVRVEAAERPVPAQLPPEPGLFVDREGERLRLNAVLARDEPAGRARYVVISGPSGSGKSALATHWLHRVRERFDDGQVYFDFHDQDSPVELADVVGHCLRAVGVEGARIPARTAEAVALLRTETDRRRMAFLFDNVPRSHELLGLRLSSADILMLITSQHTGHGLDEAEPVEIGALDPEAGVRLLADEERVAAEPEAAARIVELCGRMPLAIRVVAARLARRPKWTLERIVRQLADEARRWDWMDGDRKVQSTLNFAYSHLTEPLAHAYRLLGVVPGPSFSVDAVAALADLNRDDAEDRLEDLRGCNLLEYDGEEHYRFHDLVRPHARGFDVPDAEAALFRLVESYRRLGAFADRAVMEPTRLRVGDDDDLVAGQENPFDHATGLRWLEQERLNLVALVRASAERGWHRVVISLCDSPLWSLHNQHKYYRDMLDALDRAVTAAVEVHDLVAEARMRTLLVRLRMECHDFEAAHEHARLAAEVAERAGDRRIIGSVLEFHGRVYLEQERWLEARPLFERAHSIVAELGRPRGMALQEHFLGQVSSGLGEQEAALHTFRTALDRLTEFPDDRRTPDRIRVSMGQAHQKLDQHEQAIDVLNAAVRSMRQRGVSFDLAKPLTLLADSFEAIEDADTARRCREQALAIYQWSGSPMVEERRPG